MTARAETAEQRLAIYAGLHARNRIVAVLRVGLPALGLLVMVIFCLQIFIASLGNQFGIGNVSFNGDTVTVDTPSYSGVMANGDIYKVSAEGATTAISDLNVLDLKNATLLLIRPNGTTMTAKAAAGSFETLSQVVTVPGLAVVSNSAGDHGTLEKVVVNLPDQTLKASGHTLITMAGGMTIDAQGLAYDAQTSVWNFGRATVVMPNTPGDDDKDGDTP